MSLKPSLPASTLALLGSTALLCFPCRADDLRDRVDRLVQPYIDSRTLVGVSIGVLQDSEHSTYGFGRTGEPGSPEPDGNTVYEIGSITKVFTGLLLADAVVRGDARLDQPATELLPDGVRLQRKRYWVPWNKEAPAITLQDLSTHVSGLPRLPSNIGEGEVDPSDPYAHYTTEDLYRFVNDHQPARAPGKKYEYSNLAVGLLGHLLAQQSGQSYEALLKKTVLEPLGMNDSSITLSDGQRSRLAKPYTDPDTPAANWHLPALAGAGALRSTARDMLRFAEAQLDPPEGRLGEAINLAWQVHQEPIEGVDLSVCLGWHVAQDGSTRWHNGGTGGYRSMLLVGRQRKIAVILLTNTGSGGTDPLAKDIFRLLSGQDVQPREFEAPIEVAPEIIERYAGYYRLLPGIGFDVKLEDGKLMVKLTGQDFYRVYPRSETEWHYKVVEATITFQLDEEGNCTALELFQNGVRQKASRVE
ncbi:MAG: serine hydrolase [Planctomycetota bacterium]